MDEYTADAFVNRDEPIPSISTPGTTEPQAPDISKGKRERLKDSSKDKLINKLHVEDGGSGSKSYGYSLQDRLFTK